MVTKPTVPAAWPGRTAGQEALDAAVAEMHPFFQALIPYLSHAVDEVTAAALAGDLPDLTGQAGKLLIINDAETSPTFLDGRALISVTVYDTAGSGTFTTPAAAKKLIVDAVGAGGGGGGAQANTGTTRCSGGGGGGAFARHEINSPAASYAYTVGAAGAGGAAGDNNGSAGGATTFGAAINCGGGLGGSSPGTATASQYTIQGGAGGAVAAGGNILGSGGNPGFTGIKVSGASRTAGHGGSSPFGGAGRGISVLSDSSEEAGNNATGHGAGGSGAVTRDGGTSQPGGNGSPGLIIVYAFG